MGGGQALPALVALPALPALVTASLLDTCSTPARHLLDPTHDQVAARIEDSTMERAVIAAMRSATPTSPTRRTTQRDGTTLDYES